MTKFENNQLLRQIMSDYELKHSEVADLLSSEYGDVSRRTIENWVYDRSPLSGMIIELLKLKVDQAIEDTPDMQQHIQS